MCQAGTVSARVREPVKKLHSEGVPFCIYIYTLYIYIYIYIYSILQVSEAKVVSSHMLPNPKLIMTSQVPALGAAVAANADARSRCEGKTREIGCFGCFWEMILIDLETYYIISGKIWFF